MLNERRKRVLQALVEEYVSSATPVGSRTLVDRYGLGCSPATVRSELSILEETGYVVQPHVSAGRVPTDTGYRSFVDDLLAQGDLAVDDSTRAELHVRAEELGDLLRETSVALSRLTDCLAVVLAPSVSGRSLKRISLVPLSGLKVLFVVVTDDGRVINRHVDMSQELSSETVSELERMLNSVLVGRKHGDILDVHDAIAAAEGESLMCEAIGYVASCLREAHNQRIHHGGVPALMSQPEFAATASVAPLILALENHIRLLDEFEDSIGVQDTIVRIGHENRSPELGNVSVVAGNFGDGAAGGLVAVLGPTRMDYARAIAVVKATTDSLNDALR